MRTLNWIKNNKITVFLIIVIAILLFNSRQFSNKFTTSSTTKLVPELSGIDRSEIEIQKSQLPIYPPDDFVYEITSSEERIVVQNSNISMVVEDVRVAGEKIIERASSIGGFMVSSNYNRPNQSPFAEITVRVPKASLDDSLSYFRSLGVKVSSENLLGTDLTDSYVNIEARIEALNKTRIKFEAILESAEEIGDILQVQRELINTQSQIDNLIGQKNAIEQNVDLTKVTVYLSTDELALPYFPDKEFRPSLVFKQAVGSLVLTARSATKFAIWLGVYSIVWIPVLTIFLIIQKRRHRKPTVES